MLLAGELRGLPEHIALQAGQTGPAFFDYRFSAVILSICFLTLAAPVITCLVMVSFEKTQTQEYVFFIFFLGACLTEVIRLFIPIFDLWDSNSEFLIAACRLWLFGRILAPASFLISALFSTTRQSQDTGRNVIILAALAGVFAALIPVNTAHILPDCTVETGYSDFLSTSGGIVYFLALISLLPSARHGGREQRLMTTGYAVLAAGYIVLTGAMSFFSLLAGIGLFSAGIYLYVTNLHKLYMWN
jgi:hypothetical protein